MFSIDDLCTLTAGYLEAEQVAAVKRAYDFGAEAHEGQVRATGEPYISHPVQVAHILGEMRMDAKTLEAAILHDVIEDTEIASSQLARSFGKEVAGLVDGVSKLTQISFESRAEAQAENFRKMMLAVSKDIRVILIKLADRLHNMRTLEALSLERKRRIARETLEIYAPIANRLGLQSIRLELEDLGFSALYPMRYRVLAAEVRKARGHRKQVIRRIETAVKRRLRQEELAGKVMGREKHLYSLYKKMRTKHLSFSDVLDVYAFRIITDTADHCYRILGAVHGLYKPVPGRFKDYVALPKTNGYQSLHTVLFGPFGGVPIEMQIRTEEMHAVAESGIAAHWLYKGGQSRSTAAQKRAREWIRDLLELQSQAGDSVEFLENVKVDLFPKEVYVFTPAGDILELPRGATAVDFAYAVHTDVGNTCIAVKIDGRYAPLRSAVATGQTVEVITAPWGRPNANWLDFVTSGKARSGIRNYLKNLRTGEAVELGRRLLTQALAVDGVSLDEVPAPASEALLGELSLDDMDKLLEEVGLGKRLAPIIARRLLPRDGAGEGAGRDGGSNGAAGGAHNPLYIKGSEGMVVNFGRCCHPIPGDPIVGFVSRGRGLVIHSTACRNITEYSDRRESWVEVAWQPGLEGEFPVEIRVDTANQKGVLATVASVIADAGANIENVTMDNRDGFNASLNFVINVHDRVHLARVMRRIRIVSQVTRITRTLS
ncbi:MAG: RelA/SpoT family protein [Gammaproteobacteria bacterium]